MWQPVESSNIVALKHDETTQKLSVKFKTGAVYDYENVPKDVFSNVLNAASVGRTFNELIKANPSAYPFALVA